MRQGALIGRTRAGAVLNGTFVRDDVLDGRDHLDSFLDREKHRARNESGWKNSCGKSYARFRAGDRSEAAK